MKPAPILSLEEFCETGSGGTPHRANDQYYGGIIPWVKSGELREDIIVHTEEKITELGLKESSAKIVPAGSILLAMYGATVGRMAILGIDAATNQAVCNIRPDPKRADPRYVFHCLQSRINHFLGRAAGGAQPNISQGIIKETKIPLPSLDEQRRIAAIMDKADELRRKRKHALELLDNLTQSIFLEMFGELGSYRALTVGQSLSRPLRNGLSPAKAGSFPGKVLTLSAITGGVFKPAATKEAMFANELPSNQCVEQGEFLICRGNGNKSLVGIGVFASHSMADTLFPDTIIAGQIDPDKFHPQFFQDVWNGTWVRSQIEQSARTTNGTFKVNQRGLESVSIPMPDIALQKNYGEKVALIQQAKIVAFNQLNSLSFLYSSLQSRAFSGQL